MEMTWKQHYLSYIAERYAKYLPRCEGQADGRRVYMNTYAQITRAVNSLPEEPDGYVKAAMWHAMAEDMEKMDGIIQAFWEGEG